MFGLYDEEHDRHLKTKALLSVEKAAVEALRTELKEMDAELYSERVAAGNLYDELSAAKSAIETHANNSAALYELLHKANREIKELKRKLRKVEEICDPNHFSDGRQSQYGVL